MIESGPAPAPKLRVLHFVTGGFSGATQVAVDLCRAALGSSRIEAVLVLRRRRATDAARVQALRDQGLQVWVVPSWPRSATLFALWRICRRQRTDVLVAHGYSDHLWGRLGGWLARVPHLVHVEHNSQEPYTRWRLAQARWLAARSDRLVGVSESVRQRLVALGFAADKTMTISNGVDLGPYSRAADSPMEARASRIVMLARFAPQKDHLSLVRALGQLKARGLAPPLLLAGGGNSECRRQVQAEVDRLGLGSQVQFLGHHGQVAQLLLDTRICVLATHWEGMPLALIEGMAAGCACVASDVPGVHEVIDHGATGLLVPEGDAAALADALESLLREPGLAQRLGAAARERASAMHGIELMAQRYEDLCVGLCRNAQVVRSQRL